MEVKALNIYRIMTWFGITVVVIDLYMFVLMVCFGKSHEAVGAGMGALIGIITLAWFPFYRSEVINIWKNIKQNFLNRKGR